MEREWERGGVGEGREMLELGRMREVVREGVGERVGRNRSGGVGKEDGRRREWEKRV